MRMPKQALGVLGVLVIVITIGAVVMPKTAHALVATLVQVANDVAHPVPTIEADNPALNSFTIESQCTFGVSSDSCEADSFFSVPAAQIAVVEFVSARCALVGGSQASLELFYTGADQNPARIEVPFNSGDTINFGNFVVLNSSLLTRSYAAPGSSFRASWVTATTQETSSFCIVDMSGHYVSH